MSSLGLNSRYFSIGLVLSILLSLLAWGFREAPEAARRTFRHDILHRHEQRGMELYFRESWRACAEPFVQRPRLPPEDKLALPVYPGCEEKSRYEERVTCGIRRFARFIEDTRTDPPGSKRELVVVSFRINKTTGIMEDVRLRRCEDRRNGREALRVINLLVERGVRWSPAKRKGEPFSMELAVPIGFHGAGCGK
ncbi:energy transducer TonB [Lewinella sp. JB7]|uniref:energy transducer TonB n=1 Tax=Lewinella sp. JB7 TaxID=2962887 RepID=UPI0020C9AFAE|nr:energy transducer TonB [Lewinella sp. JB7]MCP9234468.1 energy transducer TonB [Lewinella sp. JB7]